MPETQPSGLLQFRTRAVSVMAASFALGMVGFALLLPFATPTVVVSDIVLLCMAAAVHTIAAATVGRRWEPGDAVCGGYLTVVTVLIAIAYVGAAGPALVLFAWTMWALTHRLEQALRDADEARTRLERHLDDVRQLNERLTELDRQLTRQEEV
jgi:type VI protein secretion system component VasK